MKAPGFLEGAAVALAAALAGSGLLFALGGVVSVNVALRVVVTAVGLGYFLYLLAGTRARAGRVSAVLAWCLFTGVTLALDPPLLLHVCTQVALASLLRAVRVHRSVLPAIADFVLGAIAVTAGVWAAGRTGSVFLAIWCVMLVQAAHVAIPRRGRSRHHTAEGAGEPFARAQRSAESALRRLSAAP